MKALALLCWLNSTAPAKTNPSLDPCGHDCIISRMHHASKKNPMPFGCCGNPTEVEFIAEDTEWPNLQPTGSDNQVALNLHKMAIFGDKNRNGAPWKHYLTMHAQTMEYREQ